LQEFLVQSVGPFPVATLEQDTGEAKFIKVQTKIKITTKIKIKISTPLPSTTATRALPRR
jgi:hypothetical protein